MRTIRVVGLLAVLALEASTGTSAGANYSTSAEVVDAGGCHAVSANYANDGSLGGIAGLEQAAAPAEVARVGYIGQLYQLVGFAISTGSTNVNEATSQALSAYEFIDDGTVSEVGSLTAWSVLNGPIASITTNGLLTAANVYQDTAATVGGVYEGAVSQLGLLVKNTGDDDFGIYANDGIPDWWQVQYFGVNNSNGLPTADADGTGQNNYFKYIAGLNPTNPASKFVFWIEPVAGQPAQRNLIFSPRLADRAYTIEFRTNLASGAFATLAGATTSDNGQERTVTDLSATESAKFYRVNIALVSNSQPVITALLVSGGNVVITWSAVSGNSYRVQYSSTLAAPTWSNLVPDITATGPTASNTDVGGAVKKFYRIVVLN